MQTHKISDMESLNSSTSFAFGAVVPWSIACFSAWNLEGADCDSCSIESISRILGAILGGRLSLGPVGPKNWCSFDLSSA